MSSPRVTTVLLPPAKGRSIGGDGVVPPPGKCPGGRPARQNWGKFDAHKWGEFNASHRACAALGQHRSTQRKVPRGREDEEGLTIALARQYGRYGYRKIAGLLEQAGWLVNDKRVERIWRREGLKVRSKQPKRGRLWLSDGSCIRLRPEHRNHLWSYDLLEDRTHDRRKYRNCSTSSTGWPMNAWQSRWPASSRPSM